jgi:hypothetical protein
VPTVLTGGRVSSLFFSLCSRRKTLIFGSCAAFARFLIPFARGLALAWISAGSLSRDFKCLFLRAFTNGASSEATLCKEPAILSILGSKVAALFRRSPSDLRNCENVAASIPLLQMTTSGVAKVIQANLGIIVDYSVADEPATYNKQCSRFLIQSTINVSTEM